MLGTYLRESFVLAFIVAAFAVGWGITPGDHDRPTCPPICEVAAR